MKKWKVLNESGIKNHELGVKDLIKILVENRGIKTKKEIDQFLNPKLKAVTVKSVGINSKNLKKAIERIKLAIKNQEQIVIFGDYDVDGVCGRAILWETLNALGAKVMPYIPHRVDEGYGLSIKGIENLLSGKVPPLQRWNLNETKLIITVDNGVVANKAVEFANKEGIDVIITDHHIPSNPSTGSGLPSAFAIVHTTKLCGAGVAYLLAQNIKYQISNIKYDEEKEKHLELVALATIADIVPLLGANRTLVKFGIERLRETKRIGLLELYKEAGIDQSAIGAYEIGHIIAPRLNAMGRLEYAMDSLRLLCTTNKERARLLAQKLGNTNRERQELTLAAFESSKFKVQSSKLQFKMQNLLFLADASYQQGIIGLVAGKLVEEFYKPAIVVSVGEKYSKASARSVSGFNIIEFIRGASEFLVDAGGHPMAAGFTVETSKLSLLQQVLQEKAEDLLDKEKLTRTLRIDCELNLSLINDNLYSEIQKLAPFGMGNPEPTFVSRKAVIEDMRVVGNGGRHLKMKFQISNFKFQIDGIGFGMGERASEFHIGDFADIVYTISEDRWNGNKKLQLKIKDLRK